METLNEYMHIPEPTPNKPHITIKKIVIGFTLLALCVIALMIVFIQSPNDVVKEQLAALKSGDYTKAYQMTSSDFRQDTTMSHFVSFIDKYPILKQNNGIVFNESKAEGTIGYINGKVEDKEGNTATIEYQLAKENGHWTIQAFRLSDFTTATNPMAAVDTTGAKINDILISDATDKQGYVVSNKANLPKSTRVIFATAAVSIPAPNVKISALLMSTKNGSKIGPNTGILDKSGDIKKAFMFTRDKANWPEGKYEIIISLSSGATKSVRFEVK